MNIEKIKLYVTKTFSIILTATIGIGIAIDLFVKANAIVLNTNGWYIAEGNSSGDNKKCSTDKTYWWIVDGLNKVTGVTKLPCGKPLFK